MNPVAQSRDKLLNTPISSCPIFVWNALHGGDAFMTRNQYLITYFIFLILHRIKKHRKKNKSDAFGGGKSVALPNLHLFFYLYTKHK